MGQTNALSTELPSAVPALKPELTVAIHGRNAGFVNCLTEALHSKSSLHTQGVSWMVTPSQIGVLIFSLLKCCHDKGSGGSLFIDMFTVNLFPSTKVSNRCRTLFLSGDSFLSVSCTARLLCSSCFKCNINKPKAPFYTKTCEGIHIIACYISKCIKISL